MSPYIRTAGSYSGWLGQWLLKVDTLHKNGYRQQDVKLTTIRRFGMFVLLLVKWVLPKN